MSIFSSLNRSQKEAIGLLQIGTFLEYFDLMLYVHMAVLLNELFFPKTDPKTAALLAAFAFCSTWVLRPFGALLFGWVGDNVGRKPTVVLTTSLMAISCILMASIPTYAEIGITATWLMMLCRGLQGISTTSEIIGGEAYLTEVIPHPNKYPIVASLRVVVELGGIAALLIASVVMLDGMNWRTGFWIGASIALVGSFARIRLRESQEFLTAKHNFTNKNKRNLSLKTGLAFFFTQSATPVFFVIAYIFCSEILKTKFNYTSAQIIHQNLIVTIVTLVVASACLIASKYLHPLKILRLKATANLFISILSPYLLFMTSEPQHLLLFQCCVMASSLTSDPAQAVFMEHLPILKRISSASIINAMARSIFFALTSFGIIYLVEIFGYYGLWIISIPICLAFMWGVNHFEKLENQKKHQIHTPFSTKPNEIKLTG